MKMNKSIKLIAHTISLLLVTHSLSANASEPTMLDAKIKKTTMTASDCFTASKKCLLEVTPITSSHGDRLFNVLQSCDLQDIRLKYLYKMPMTEQLTKRTYLGKSFCRNTVSISDMNLPFGKENGVEDANDALLLIEEAEQGIHDIQSQLKEMQKLAVEAASGKYSSTELSDLNTEFNALLNEINRVAFVTNFAGYNLLESKRDMNVPINKDQNHITVKLSNMTTGSAGLNIASLEIDTVDQAKEAIKELPRAIQATKAGVFNLELSVPALKLAAAHDATITTVNLGEDVIVVKRVGMS